MEFFLYVLLFLFSFTEALINPIPVDLLIIFMVKKNYSLFWTIIIALLGNLCGALLAYYIGLKISYYNKLQRFIEKSKMEKILKKYEKRKELLLFLSTFTPLPYKIFTYLSGYTKVNLFLFLFYSLIGRGARFFLVGITSKQLTIQQIIILLIVLLPIYIITEKKIKAKFFKY